MSCGRQPGVGPASLPACALSALLNSAGTIFSPSLLGPLPAPAESCCPFRKECQKLRVIIITPPAFSPIPGASSTGFCSGTGLGGPTSPQVINQAPGQCQPPLTSGVPASWCGVKLAARPAGVFVPHGGVPKVIRQAFPGYAKCMKTFMFDFGPWEGSTPGGPVEARVLAFGLGGSVQATMLFRYRWCGPATCAEVVLPQFEVVSSSGVNARFTVLDGTSFLSDDPCTPSTVVLMLQQWCCDGDFPAEVSKTALGLGEGVLTEPPAWFSAPMNCVDASTLKSCTGGPCFAPRCVGVKLP